VHDAGHRSSADSSPLSLHDALPIFVTDKTGRLKGVLTERDIFAKLVGVDVDLEQPVESLMVDHPWTLHLEEPIRHAIDLMQTGRDRKSTRLNSSHSQISYAVFCLKK